MVERHTHLSHTHPHTSHTPLAYLFHTLSHLSHSNRIPHTFNRILHNRILHNWDKVDREFDSDTFLPPRTVAFLQAQDLEPYVTQRLEEGGVRYRIVELPVKSCTPINSQLDSPV
mmetsp:Transcript_9189/g.20063  ORF Transcript_9189/g.20063 Transcript_9189/m.20063 type:complete len:115 (+) Transcript_9189:6-350(+)